MIARVAAAIVLALAPSNGDVAFHFKDNDLTESSALVVLPSGNFVTTNDSGDSARVFVVSPTGTTLRVSEWGGEATDVEALAPVVRPARSDRVWVGDIGDNTASRDTIEIAQAKIGLDGIDSLEAFPPLTLRYPDGAHDAETLMAAPDGRLLIVTKGFLGGTLYAVPTSYDATRPITLEPLSSAGAMLPMATDGAFFPDGRHFLVRGYTSATLYAWPSLERLGSMPLPHQKQGEGLGIAPDDTLWLSSEGVHADVLHIQLSPALTAIVEGGSPTTSPSTSGATHEAPATAPPPAAAGSGTSWWPWLGGGAVALALLAYLARRRG